MIGVLIFTAKATQSKAKSTRITPLQRTWKYTSTLEHRYSPRASHGAGGPSSASGSTSASVSASISVSSGVGCFGGDVRSCTCLFMITASLYHYLSRYVSTFLSSTTYLRAPQSPRRGAAGRGAAKATPRGPSPVHRMDSQDIVDGRTVNQSAINHIKTETRPHTHPKKHKTYPPDPASGAPPPAALPPRPPHPPHNTAPPPLSPAPRSAATPPEACSCAPRPAPGAPPPGPPPASAAPRGGFATVFWFLERLSWVRAH